MIPRWEWWWQHLTEIEGIGKANKFGVGKGCHSRWYVLFCAGWIWSANVLPISHLCTVLISAATAIPRLLLPCLFIKQTFGCLWQCAWVKPSSGPCLSLNFCHSVFPKSNLSNVCPHTHKYTCMCEMSIWWLELTPGGYNELIWTFLVNRALRMIINVLHFLANPLGRITGPLTQ